jgi:hypothetical protein
MRMCIGNLKNGVGRWRVFEGVEQTKVKHTHKGHTLTHPSEHQLNNENQD